MVQVLPYVPSFGEKLGEVLANAGADISQGYLNRYQRRSDQKIFDQIASSEDQSPLNMVKAASQLSPEAQKNLSPLLKYVIQSQQKTVDPKTEEKLRAARGAQASIERFRELMPYTGTTVVPGYKGFLGGVLPLNREAVEKRTEADQQAFMLEGFLREKASKGTLPVKIFETLLTKLPSSKLSDRENEGRLKGIETQLKAYFPEEFGKNSSMKEEKQKTLDEETATKLLKKANGDVEKARALARKAGYSF